MRANFNEPLDLAELAEVACISRFHFVRVFEEVTGTSPHTFLTSLRIERAKELLVDTDMPVTDVCMEVGYSSLGSFSTSFAELVGFTPSAFREAPNRLSPEEFFELAQAFVDQQRRSPGPFIVGRLDSPCESRGYHFVGLFTRGIPQGVPVSGTVMLTPGQFRIPAPGTRTFHLLAAVLPFSFVFSKLSKSLPVTLVASKRVELSAGAKAEIPPIRLRPPVSTDPPIVVSILALLRIPPG
jgi:AraC-like DNA-binding protein